MPTVPVARNEVNLASTTDAKLRPADWSGTGAEALGSGMQQVGKAGTEFAQAWDEHRAVLEQAGARDMEAGFTRTITDAVATYQGRTGSDATNETHPALESLDKLGKAVLDQTISDRQKRLLAPVIAARVNSARDAVLSHSLQQSRVYATEAVGAVADASASAAVRAANGKEYTANIQHGTDAIRGWWSDHEHADPAVVAQHVAEFESKAATQRVDYLIGTGKIDEAQAFRESNLSSFSGQDLSRVDQALHPILERRAAEADVDSQFGHATVEGGATNFVAPLRDSGHAPVPGGQYGAPRTYGGQPGKHQGVDQPAPVGTPIRSGHGAGTAVVTHSPLGGNIVEIKHDDGYTTKYMHLGKVAVQNGARVTADTVLGAVGMTGRSTGPHLHYEVVDAQGKHVDPSHIVAQVQHGPAREDLGGMIDALDKRTDLTPEQKDMRRSIILQRVGVADHVRERAYSDAEQEAAAAISKIGPDNFTSIAQLPASVRSALKPSDYLHLQTQAQSNADARDQRDASMNLYRQMSANPGTAWNVYDPAQVRAANAAVTAAGGTPMAAFTVWQKTGILAKPGAIALRGGLVSIDPAQVGTSANIAGNMIRQNPNAFAGVEGREDIEKAAVAFNHYVYDLGMTPQQASTRVAKENDPAFKSKLHLGQPERDQFMKTMRQQGLSAAAALGGQFYGPSQAQEADHTYAEMTLLAMDRGADVATAQAQAKAQMQKIYGVTRDGHVTKYAPERGYPAVAGSHDYVYRDAIATVVAETHLKPSEVKGVHIVPIPGVTDQDFRNGAPPRYRLLYERMVDGQKVYDYVPGQWAADVQAATTTATRQHAQDFQRERVRRDRNVARLNPSGRVRPETGPGSNPLEDQ